MLLQIDDSIVSFLKLFFIVSDRGFSTLSLKQNLDAFFQFTIDLDVALHSLLKLKILLAIEIKLLIKDLINICISLWQIFPSSLKLQNFDF